MEDINPHMPPIGHPERFIGSSKDHPNEPLCIEEGHWDLAQAVVYVRGLQEAAHAAGYNLLIGGGVLNNGYSFNDLDIVAMPRGGDTTNNMPALMELFRIPDLRNQCVIQRPCRIVYRCFPRTSVTDTCAIDLIVVQP